MYQLVIYRNNEVFEPYIETTSSLRETVKSSGGQFNAKTRRYQMPVSGYEDFLCNLIENGLNFHIVNKDLASDKAGSKSPKEVKTDVLVELRLFKDTFQIHLNKFSHDAVDVVKLLPARTFMIEGDRKWWQSPIDHYQQLCDLLNQNNITYTTVSG